MNHSSLLLARNFGLSRSKGSALVLFAIVAFVLFALAALTIDLGVLQMTNRQMQVAADGAAIQGLRVRDNMSIDDRQLAADHVSAVFDDDFDTSSDPLGLGAGPIIGITAPNFDPLNTNVSLIDTSSGPYDPELQENPTNEAHGDILTGNYLPNERHDEGYNVVNFYARDDFPANFDELTPNNSFMVRLRRTRDADGLDNIAGISSAGPSLPFIFGQALPIGQAAPGEINPKVDGLSLSTTSIADAQVTLSVGPAHTPALSGVGGIPGLAYFTLDIDYFNLLPVGVFSDALILADGSIMGVGVTTGGLDGALSRRTQLTAAASNVDTTLSVSDSTGFPSLPFTIRLADELVEVTSINFGTDEWTVTRGVQGSSAAGHAIDAVVNLFEISVIGDAALSTLPVNILVPPSVEPEFVQLFDDVLPVGDRVVGFGGIMIQPTGIITNPPVFPVPVQLMRTPSFIPDQNASAKLARQVDPLLSAVQVDTIFTRRNSIDGPLRSPALVLTHQ